MNEKEIYNMWNSREQDISPELVESSLKLLLNRINLFEHEKSAKRQRRKKFYWGYTAAATVLVPVLLLFWMMKPDVSQTYIADIVYSVPAGESKRITLADSTVVYLNSKSILISPGQFVSAERNVFLIGEAYFKVAKNTEKPFVVRTQLMTIEALGTEFSVLAYPQSSNVKTTLVEGSVKVKTVDAGAAAVESVILKPAQQSYYDSELEKIRVNNINVDAYISWISGNLIFENTPFPDVIERIEIQFGKKIAYNNMLKKERISAKFVHKESLDEILTLISEITYSKVRKVENIYLIE